MTWHTLQAVYIIWRRDMVRWWRDKARIISALTFPVIFLVVFGNGLSGAMGPLVETAGTGPASVGGMAVDYKQFIFPGVIAMNIFFASIFSGISVVFDREFGILKEVLVAPVSRGAVALGKTLGGASVATVQGTLVLLIAPLAGVELTLGMVLRLWPLMFIGAFAMTSMGVALGSRMKSVEGFQAVNQFIAFPMIFLSGAFFPMRGLPTWMEIIVKVNPASYAVDPLRRTVLEAQGLPAFVLNRLAEFGLGLELFGRPLEVWHDVLIVLGFGIVMNALAMYLFSRGE